ncbi:succinate dehydrogenase [Sulfurifustis variabilis]|uniref:Succinate dehydrogenase n=1 Tax=Sulfurifustis variabilis TaxID=1675686 RepID=A0A1B4V4R5_9GAMM|nr:succinate dehydrogenase [Sulfurifustis variabilis]BAU48405.1 succinate dehydrogenase [Sulfurifustis variabilis]
MSAAAETRLWLAQRATAGLLAVFVAVHLVTVAYAVRGGLTAAEILGRLQGHAGWFAFYALFALAAAAHGAIGLRVIAREWLGWHGRSLEIAAVAAGIALAFLGLKATWAVTAT